MDAPSTVTNRKEEGVNDLNIEATRALASQSLDLRLIPAPGGNFHSADCSVKLLNEVLADVQWSLSEQPARDPCVAECIGAFVHLLADRHQLPNTAPRIEETTEFLWTFYRMLFAGLGHNHHRDVVQAMAAVDAGCPWDEGETVRQWTDAVLEARKASQWPAVLLRAPWRPFVRAMADKAGDDEAATGQRFHPWWREACLLWHLVRHLRRGEGRLVYTFEGRWGALDFPKDTTSIGSLTSFARIARHLGIPVAAAKADAHPLAAAAQDVLLTTNRALLLARKSLACLPVNVIHSPASTYLQDRGRYDPWFEHGLGVGDAWVAANGRVHPASDLHLASDVVVGYDWYPAAVPSAAQEGMGQWKDRLVTSYSADAWPSQVLHRAFPNIRWRDAAHETMFDAVACLSVIRDAHPVLTREFPFLVLLAQNPGSGEHIRNGKTAATKALVSMFAPDAPVTGLSTQPSNMESRITLVSIRDHGTVGLDEWQLPSDGNHPLNREAIATLCTGGSRSCGLVLSNEPLYIRLRHPLVVNAKTVILPVDIESRSLFLWLDQIPTEQAMNGDAYQAAVGGQLGLRLRLAALAQVEANGIESWVSGLNAGTTQHGWRFGLHRQVAAGIYAHRFNTTIEVGLDAVDTAYRDMLKAYHQHTDAGEASGLLDMLQTGKTMRLSVAQLFDVTPEMMGIYVERIRSHARTLSFTAGQLLRAILDPFITSDPSGSVSSALARFTGQKSFENGTPRLLGTLLTNDLTEKMPEVGAYFVFPGELGLAGWWIKREPSEDAKPPRFSLGCQNPDADKGVMHARTAPLRTGPNPAPTPARK